ncbi:hypothetical protein VR7878_03005 [Vibrio ruber DSM 16370]|uniref:Uncharacterized protein n=1 Tax=Vibrio ruber (strain DSM 16370 / JCM 11486 / BCRC 17186 / CECT 7878 / LMG 23124 / VR1) TaxID=1123498 RepID=A0A1R4LQD2_VIBR1|nr:hypothetical protein VR7878_03005 [Vibrio ruber DSM 16370]
MVHPYLHQNEYYFYIACFSLQEHKMYQLMKHVLLGAQHHCKG